MSLINRNPVYYKLLKAEKIESIRNETSYYLFFTALSVFVLLTLILLSSFDFYGFGDRWINSGLFVCCTTPCILYYFEKKKIILITQHLYRLGSISENVLDFSQEQIQKLNQEFSDILHRKMNLITRALAIPLVIFAIYCYFLKEIDLWNLGKVLVPLIWSLIILLYNSYLEKLHKNLIAFERFAN
ncbi:MAG: hypothetical protein NW226_06660 [Microscillaceae bacterium]|nr:hypothetical protein [Microscillaceae bacterium]